MRSGARVDRSERRPRNKAEEARAKEATRALLKQADGLFASPKSDALARAVRDAQGTAGFDDACAAYRAELGMPRDAALLNVFLDATDARLLADVLEAMLEHAFTLEEYQGLGVMPYAHARLAEQAKARGARYVVGYIDRRNNPSLMSAKRAGFAPFQLRTDRWRLFKRTVSYAPWHSVPRRTPTTGTAATAVPRAESE